MEKIIDYSNASKLRDGAREFSEVKDSYLFCSLNRETCDRLRIEGDALKLNGTLVILVRDGDEFDIEINLETYRARPNTFIVAFPGNVVQIKQELPENLEAYLLFFNLSFLQNVNINMAPIALPPILERPEPLRELSSDEGALLLKYFELLHENSLQDGKPAITRSIATSLIAAMFYQMVQFYHKHLEEEQQMRASAKPVSRRNDYVREFIRLVHIHFIKERSVSFYASKLFISPKYLSLLVKEATGRSASRWIDDFVLMEAKNMLRYSGKNIQQVAYALNFTTQSSFGKYFKHLTGMSPTEYQKS